MRAIQLDGSHGHRCASSLDHLKWRLLLRRLETVPNAEWHPAVMCQADAAAGLARQTAFPLLLFPCLFEERAGVALEQARLQTSLYWRRLEAMVV